MLLFFLHIAPHLSHKTSNDLRAVVLLLSLRSLRCYVRYLKYSMQKLRGARLRFYSLCVVVVGDLWLFCEQPADGRRVDRVDRIASLDGVDRIASLDGAIGNASLDGRDYQMSNE